MKRKNNKEKKVKEKMKMQFSSNFLFFHFHFLVFPFPFLVFDGVLMLDHEHAINRSSRTDTRKEWCPDQQKKKEKEKMRANISSDLRSIARIYFSFFFSFVWSYPGIIGSGLKVFLFHFLIGIAWALGLIFDHDSNENEGKLSIAQIL